MKKICGRCREEKSLVFFSKDKYRKDGYSNRCKDCQKLAIKNSKKSCDPEELKARAKIYRKKYIQSHPVDQAARTAAKYGLTTEQYRAILDYNNGLCLICNENKSTCLDHCHKTGKNRGGLCSNCNTAIGLLRDRVDLLESAIQYLKK